MKSFKLCTVFFICFFILAVIGCASIVSKSSYPVTINSTPDQADITIVDETGRIIHSGKTPSTVTLDTKAGFFSGKNYTVKFKKKGYNEHSANIKRGVDGWYIVGNLLFGGLIGWLIVDPATGAMWTLQSELHATLTPKTSSIENKNRLRIILIDDVPTSIQSKLIRIN